MESPPRPAASPPVVATTTTTTCGGGCSDQGKVFVGGISFDTTAEALQDHFGKYGDVLQAIVIADKFTGCPRGFGFVCFSDPSSAEMAIQDNAGKQVVLGRTVEVKKAQPWGERHQNHLHHDNDRGLNKCNDRVIDTRKIFVGGLSSDLTKDEFRSYFEKFGRVIDAVVMCDSVTHQPRGFGFITFETEESVPNVMQTTFYNLNGKHVEVKRAVPKESNQIGDNSCSTSSNCINSNSYNGNPYNPRMGNGIQYVYGNYPGIYPPYSYAYGYGSSHNYGACFHAGGYRIGSYYGMGYGSQYLRRPWREPGLVCVSQTPVPYFNVAPYYGSYMAMETNVKLDKKDSGLEVLVFDDSTPSQDEGGKLDG